jgi:hypothetical protein
VIYRHFGLTPRQSRHRTWEALYHAEQTRKGIYSLVLLLFGALLLAALIGAIKP